MQAPWEADLPQQRPSAGTPPAEAARRQGPRGPLVETAADAPVGLATAGAPTPTARPADAPPPQAEADPGGPAVAVAAGPPPGRRGPLARLPAWCFGNIGWLLAGRALRSFSQAFLVIGVPLYVAAAGYSTLQIGYLLSAGSFGSVVFMLGIGLFADRYGRRQTMLVLSFLSVLGAAAYALTANFLVLALGAALASVGRGGGAGSGGAYGPFYPAEQALVAGSCTDRDRNAAFGALSFIGVLAGAAGSAVAVLPQLAHDGMHLPWVAAYRLLFWLAAAAGAALVLVVLPIREVRRPSPGRARLSRATIRLLGKLWLTNGTNGIAWGLLGPFLTYWLYVRFGVGPAALGSLFTVVNLAAAFPYLGAAAVARRLGAVATVVLTRVVSVVFFVGMVVAPTFALASGFYLLRMVFGSLGMPVRQSFVMGVSEERNRSTVAAFGNLPAQVTSAISPSLGAYMMTAVSLESPLLLAAGVQLVNAGAFLLAFRHTRPPEEQAAAR